MRDCLRALTLVLIAPLCGCSLPEQRADFASDDPGERVNAAARAARDGDKSKARELVECLESSDAALRLVASRALFEMNSGETFGYDHTLPATRQPEQMKRWRAWADLQKGKAERPGS
ncbi:MAG: hypothetical protein ACKVZJ_06260 [Phycisphaerales bacterium]